MCYFKKTKTIYENLVQRYLLGITKNTIIGCYKLKTGSTYPLPNIDPTFKEREIDILNRKKQREIQELQVFGKERKIRLQEINEKYIKLIANILAIQSPLSHHMLLSKELKDGVLTIFGHLTSSKEVANTSLKMHFLDNKNVTNKFELKPNEKAQYINIYQTFIYLPEAEVTENYKGKQYINTYSSKSRLQYLASILQFGRQKTLVDVSQIINDD